MNTAEAQWYVYQGNEQLGPFSLADLTQKISQKQIGNEAFAYTDGFKDWTPIKDIPELAPHVSGGGGGPGKSNKLEQMWSLNKDGQTLGSFDITEIQKKLKSGEVSGRDYVWTDGWPDWIPLEEADQWKEKVTEITSIHDISRANPTTNTPFPGKKGKPAFTTSTPKPAMMTQESGSSKVDDLLSSSSSATQVFSEEGLYKPPKRRTFLKIMFLLLLGGLGYYGYQNKDKLPLAQIQNMIPKSIWKPKSNQPQTNTSGTPTPAAVTGVKLQKFITQIQSPTGITPQLFADQPVVGLKLGSSGVYHMISHTTANPIFFHQRIEAPSSTALSPVLPQSGPTKIYLYKKENQAFKLISEKTLSLINNKVSTTLTPLPQRADRLNDWFENIEASIKKMQKYSKRRRLWAKSSLKLWKTHMSFQPWMKDCLKIIHLPAPCSQLGQLWKDGLDVHSMVVILSTKKPLSQVKKQLGRSPKEISTSLKTNIKALTQFVENPKALETVNQEDIQKWLQTAYLKP